VQDTDSVQYNNGVFRFELALVCVLFGVYMWCAKPERIVAAHKVIGNNPTMTSKAPYAP
jgi:hypothetical protein